MRSRHHQNTSSDDRREQIRSLKPALFQAGGFGPSGMSSSSSSSVRSHSPLAKYDAVFRGFRRKFSRILEQIISHHFRLGLLSTMRIDYSALNAEPTVNDMLLALIGVFKFNNSSQN